MAELNSNDEHVAEWKGKREKAPSYLKYKQQKEEVVPALKLMGGGLSEPEYRHYAEPITGETEQLYEKYLATISKATGTLNENLGVQLILQVQRASPHGREMQQIAEAISASLLEAKPQDAIEGMIVTQLIALHNQMMEFMRRTLKDNPYDQVIDLNINRYSKLNVRFLHTLEMLNRYRQKGNQSLHVGNLTINHDGKAVIGNFKTP
ncbi:MAG: hypothetical protein NT065_03765 [Chlamydiae bacterium]|nr:hypothetical protein [Chlamydiota bacterium]